MKLEEIVYAAGFFDGEGSICIERPGKNHGHRLKLFVTQKLIRAPLDFCFERWGGRVHESKARPGVFTWQIEQAAALPFLKAIEPFLLVKREQARIAIDFQIKKHIGERRSNELVAREDAARRMLLSEPGRGKIARRALVIAPHEQASVSC